eukprot:m.179481 g.179481  ORF g.179481 m.179481 type:complete len:385 (+) comp15478_c0_seq2:4630-5784(+)
MALKSIIEYSPKAALDVCINKYPSILPWSVSLALEQHDSRDFHYYHYLGGIMHNHVDSRQEKHLVHEWLRLMMLQTDVPQDCFRAEGKKLAQSQGHKIHWKQEDIFNRVIEEADNYASEPRFLIKLFKDYGYWSGVITLLKKLKSRRSEMELASLYLYLGELKDLAAHIDGRTELWKATVTVMAEKIPSFWHPITIKSLFTEMALQLGGFQALPLLQILNEKNLAYSIPPEVYGHVNKTEKLASEQSAIAHEILVSLDSYLWSKRSDVLSPQLALLVDSELKVGEGNNVEEMESNEEQEKSLLDSLLQEGLDFEEDIPSYLEDPLVHWGVQGRLSQCALCSLQIFSEPELATTTFRCGHIFHTQCIPAKVCPICVQSKLTTLFD